MNLVTLIVHVVIGNNSTIQSKDMTLKIPRYCCPNHHRSNSMFHSWN